MSGEAEKRIISNFGAVASALGYNEVHGKILAVLLVEGQSVALQDLASKTSYSLSTISLSIDFLEVLGVIKKMRKDRKIYVELVSDLFDCLRKAALLRIEKSIGNALKDFESERNKTADKKLLKTINILEKEIKRLQNFVDLISSASPNGK